MSPESILAASPFNRRAHYAPVIIRYSLIEVSRDWALVSREKFGTVIVGAGKGATPRWARHVVAVCTRKRRWLKTMIVEVEAVRNAVLAVVGTGAVVEVVGRGVLIGFVRDAHRRRIDWQPAGHFDVIDRMNSCVLGLASRL